MNRVGPVAATLGAPARRRAHAGTTLSLTVSAAAAVRFTVKRLSTGVRTGRRCRALRPKRGQKRCTIARTVHSFAVLLPSGSTAVPYSGRYRRSGRTRSLRPGRYRIEAAPVSATGALGAARARNVTVVR